MKQKKNPSEYPILMFESPAEWRAWLELNCETAEGMWMRFAKKRSTLLSITYEEALDVALCFGWIDSLVKTYDEGSYIQKFTPRGARSVWSKRNVEKIEALTRAGLMHAAGLAAVERSKANGQWDAAYDSPANAVVPDDLAAALASNPDAQTFFETLTKANRYAVIWRVKTAKRSETRERRIRELIAMLARGEKYHP